jgi:predicted MPP superfamily phosphohydrolase
MKLISVEKRKQFSYRYRTFLLMILISVFVVIAGVINLNTIRVSKYTIEVNAGKSEIEKLRIAFVADFHIDYKTRMAYVEQFVNKTNALKPDLVLYGGDIVEGNRKNRAVEEALKKIEARFGIYGVLGNHEFYRNQDDGRFFRRADIKLLNDTVINIKNLFYLGGRIDQQSKLRKPAGEVLSGVLDDLPVILMDHRPTELQQLSKSKVDVQFSGHTHNGQLFPINYIIKGMYELSWGYKKIRDTHFFVTSGLRLWGPPVKTTGKSEIMLVDITFK